MAMASSASFPLHFIAVASLLLLASGPSHSFQTPSSSSGGSHGRSSPSPPSSSSTKHNAFLITSPGLAFQSLIRKQSIIDPVPLIPMDTSVTNNPKIPTALSPAEEKRLAALATATTIAAPIPTSRGESTTSQEQYLRSLSTTLPSWRNTPFLRSLIPSKQMMPELVDECFGTLVLLHLVLGIVPSAVLCGNLPGGVFSIAILTGMSIPVACASVTSKSPAHFNPAITWAMCLYRGFGWHKLLPYMAAQLLGATAAAGINYVLFAPYFTQFEITNGLVRTSIEGGALQTAKSFACYFNDPISEVTAIFSETWGTFVLTSVVFALTSQRNTEVKGLFIPPLIGSAVALIICIIGPVSGASLNPARELGPRFILSLAGWSSSAAFYQLPIYIGSAFMGATLGGLFVDHILYSGPSTSQQQLQQQQLQHEPEGFILSYDPAVKMKEHFS